MIKNSFKPWFGFFVLMVNVAAGLISLHGEGQDPFGAGEVIVHEDFLAYSSLLDIIHGGGVYLVRTNSGSILKSTDGDVWEVQPDAPAGLEHFTWSSGRFFGINSEFDIYESLDGSSWTLLGNADSITHVFFENGRYVYAAGICVYSTSSFAPGDRTSFRQGTQARDMLSLGQGKMAFVAGQSVYHSVDHGVTWELVPEIGSTNTVSLMASSGNRALVMGTVDRNPVLWLSDDQGLSWQQEIPVGLELAVRIRKVIWNGVNFVLFTNSGDFYQSDDGIAWTPVNDVSTEKINDIAGADGEIITIGESGGIRILDTDGNWASRYAGAAPRINASFYFQDEAFIGGDGGFLAHQAGDSSWIFTNSGTLENLFGGASNNEVAIVVGAKGTILMSEDGSFWSQQITDTNFSLRDVTWAGSVFIAVGYGGVILTSPDGEQWARSTTLGENLRAVIWTGNQAIAVGDAGAIFRSATGVNWERMPADETVDLFGIASHGEDLVAVGHGGFVLHSHNGGPWKRYQISTLDLEDVVAVSEGFMAVGQNGLRYVSTFGRVWRTEQYDSHQRLYTIGEHEGNLVVGGVTGSLHTHSLPILTDNLPDISIATEANVNEATGQATVTVFLAEPVQWEVEATLGFSDITAMAGLDYQIEDVEQRSVVIPPGETTATISFPLKDDLLVEGDEELVVGLERALNARITQRGMVLRIVDNDAVPAANLTVENVNVREKQYTANIRLVSEEPLEARARIRYETRSGSAVSPGDFLPVKGTLIFEKGDREGWITVPLQANDEIEEEESFYIDFTELVGIRVVGGNRAEVRILGQDNALSVGDPEPVHEKEDAMARFFIENRSSSGAWVDFTTEDGAATAGVDYVATEGRLFVPPEGAWVEVPLLDDGLVEKNEAFGLLVTSETAVMDDDFASVRIYSNDRDANGYGPVYSKVTTGYGGVVWTGDQFLLQMPYGIASSADGLAWNLEMNEVVPHAAAEFSMGQGKVIATGAAAASRDGTSWRDIQLCKGDPDSEWTGSCFVPIRYVWMGDRYIAQGYFDKPWYNDTFAVSEDGYEWTLTAERLFSGHLFTGKPAWSGTRLWLGRHDSNNNRTDLYSSKQGASWTFEERVRFPYDPGTGPFWFDGRLSIPTGRQPFVNDLSISTDQWTEGPRAVSDVDVFYNGTRWISRTSALLTSEDGEVWDETTIVIDGVEGGNINSLAWNGEFYAGVNDQGIFRSTDGIHWTSVDLRMSAVKSERLLVRDGQIYARGVGAYKLTDENFWQRVEGDEFVLVDRFLPTAFLQNPALEWQNQLYRIQGIGGRDDIIAVLRDDEEWYSELYLSFQKFHQLATDESRLVALLKKSGSTVLLSKTAGSSWAEQAINVTGEWTLLAMNAERMVIANPSGSMAVTVDDGVTWEQVPFDLPQYSQLERVTYENGEFFAFSTYGPIFRSEDALSWELFPQSGQDLIWSGNEWLLLRNGLVYESQDLESWVPLENQQITMGNMGVPGTLFELNPIRQILGEPPSVRLAVEVPDSVIEGETFPIIFTLSEASEDVVSASVRIEFEVNGILRIFEEITFQPGETRKELQFETFDDDIFLHWETTALISAVVSTVGNGTIDPAGYNGTIRVYDNDIDRYGNQEIRHLEAVTDLNLYGITFHENMGIIVGENGGILRSEDRGNTWEAFDAGIGEFVLEDVTWAGDRFIAVGQGGRMVSSADGKVWHQLVSGTTRYLYGVHWTGNLAIAVGSDTLLTSSNLIEWTGQDSGVNSLETIDQVIFKAVTSNDHGIVVAGEHGIVLRSTDGETWTASQVGSWSPFFQTLCWTGDRYVAAGISTLWASRTGLEWTAEGWGSTRGIASNGTSLVGVGANSVTYYSSQSLDPFETYYADKHRHNRFLDYLDLRDVAWSGEAFFMVGRDGFVGKQVSPVDPLMSWNRWLWNNDDHYRNRVTINSPVGAPLAINNASGIPNYVAYALGIDPTDVDGSALLALDVSGEHPRLALSQRVSDAELVEIEIQRCEDLETWETIMMWTGSEWIGSAERDGYGDAFFDLEATSDSSGFYRLKFGARGALSDFMQQ